MLTELMHQTNSINDICQQCQELVLWVETSPSCLAWNSWNSTRDKEREVVNFWFWLRSSTAVKLDCFYSQWQYITRLPLPCRRKLFYLPSGPLQCPELSETLSFPITILHGSILLWRHLYEKRSAVQSSKPAKSKQSLNQKTVPESCRQDHQS